MKEFTPLEKYILQSFGVKWKYIARDKDGTIYLYTAKPMKNRDMWRYSTLVTARDCKEITGVFKRNIFKQIKFTDREPINIKQAIEVQDDKRGN